MNFHAPISAISMRNVLPAPVVAAPPKRANFAPMPRTATEWGACYSVAVNFDRLEPRVCIGETLIFSCGKVAKKGDLVCIRSKENPDALLIGVLLMLGPKMFRIALSLDGSNAVPGTLSNSDIHPAVAVMSTRLDTEEGREIARANAAKRRGA